MKKIWIVAIAAITLMTGCDLDRFPYSSYSASTIQDDPEAAVDILLNGNYSCMRTVYDTYIRFGEYRSDNVRKDKPTTAGYWYYYTWDRDPSAGNPNDQWNNGYKIISQSSEIMPGIGSEPWRSLPVARIDVFQLSEYVRTALLSGSG